MKKVTYKNKLNFKPAFTLAEVLITLAIIGIVASLTIPSVVQNYQERQTVTQLNKFYSDINQAFNMAKANKGDIENQNIQSNTDLYNYFSPYLKIIKTCTYNDRTCFYNGDYKTLNPNAFYPVSWLNDNARKFVLNYGVSVVLAFDSSDCTYSNGFIASSHKALQYRCGSIIVDLNGQKAPNQLGVDTFRFYITKYGVLPYGMKNDTNTNNLKTRCNKDAPQSQKFNGQACTAWVLYKGNMDYLKKTVSW